MAYKKKATSRKSTKRAASSRRKTKKSAGVVGWVEHLFGLDKKARKSASSSRKKYAK